MPKGIWTKPMPMVIFGRLLPITEKPKLSHNGSAPGGLPVAAANQWSYLEAKNDWYFAT